MVAPLIGAALISTLGSGLAGYFGGKSQEESDRQAREYAERTAAEKRARQQTALSGYGYTPYGQTYTPYAETPYTSQLQPQISSTLSQFLSGELTPAQRAEIEQQTRVGREGIARTAAGRGMPGGAQSALAVQLARDIAIQGGKLAGEQQRYGVSAALPYEQMLEQRFLRPQEIARAEKEKVYGYGLSEWLRQQDADRRRQELLASYA